MRPGCDGRGVARNSSKSLLSTICTWLKTFISRQTPCRGLQVEPDFSKKMTKESPKRRCYERSSKLLLSKNGRWIITHQQMDSMQTMRDEPQPFSKLARGPPQIAVGQQIVHRHENLIVSGSSWPLTGPACDGRGSEKISSWSLLFSNEYASDMNPIDHSENHCCTVKSYNCRMCTTTHP
jgi:hypothetical protein